MDLYTELLTNYPEVRYHRSLFGTWASQWPVDGGKPSRGTKADQRLKENKTAKPAAKPAPKKGK